MPVNRWAYLEELKQLMQLGVIDDVAVLAETEIEIEIKGKSLQPQIGDEVFIPAKSIHTVRNIGKTNNFWYYGYKS